MRRKLTRLAAVGAAVVAGSSLLASCSSGDPASYTVKAVFSDAEGLYPGNSVEVLGVAEGSVSHVQPVGSHVVVTMSINRSQSLPSNVNASLVTPLILGEPSVELFPGYTRGAKLEGGAVIPESRTSVPVSIGQILSDLQRYLGQVNTKALGGVISNLAQDLKGQGEGLNALISQGAQTLELLAQKGNQLGQLNGSLAQITGTLDQRTSSLTNLIQAYDTVGNVISQDSGPLGNAVTQLADMSQQLSELLDPNLQPLSTEISTITQVGRTLSRNLSSVDGGLSSTVALFEGAGRAYDPVNNWLDVNAPLEPGLTSDTLAGLIRDRLAGICQRVLANHSAGLSASEISTLQTCGNPSSGFFDSLLSVLPDALNDATNGSAPAPGSSAPSAQSVMSQGVNEIPGISSSQSQQLTQIPASALSGSGSSSSSSSVAGSSPLEPSSPQGPSSSSGGLLGGLVHGLLGVVHVFGGVGHFFGGVGHFFGSLL
jgi:phospholipid/cholesterol/gamma-HCH transport system substrate-binding protein